MLSGRLFHKEGPMYDKVVCLVFCPVLAKRVLKFCKAISLVYSTVWSKFKNFIQINRAAVVDKLESYWIYTLVNSYFSRQPIYRSKLVRDICCI